MKELTWSAAVGDFRTKGKCFALHGSFFIVLLLCMGHGSCRPEQSDDDFKLRMIRENTTATATARTTTTKIKLNTIANGGEYDKADKEKMFILNHPEITYKEDYVNEDYKDPVKHSVKSDIPITAESYKRLKPEKIYFDVLPKKPVIVIENLPKISKSRLKGIPLSEDVTDKQSNKLSDNKTNNKSDEILYPRKKRSTQTIPDNPYFQNMLMPCSNCGGANGARVQYIFVNRPVPGKKHNALDIPVRAPPSTDMPISFDSRIAADENDRVIFSGGSRATQRPVATRRPPESIFRNPNPGNFDFSFMNPGMQDTQLTRPMGSPAANAPRITTMRPLAPPSAAPSPTPGKRGISQCVWAIVNCCSNGDSEIRYSCFEQNGCYGAFWDLNPCAESVRDNIITYVADYYD